VDRGHAQVRYQIAVGTQERLRLFQGILVATLASLSATLLWSWMIHQSLPFGLAVGIATVAASVASDRRRLRHSVAALVRNLPLLVDPRGEQPR
jgi:hypothetical protein